MSKITFSLLFALSTITTSQTDSLVTIMEVMFRPNTSNSEFIELYNTSDSENIDLANFQIVYHTSSADIIIAHEGGSTILLPNSYAVIFEGDYDFAAGIYSGIVPDEALLLKIDNNAFGSSGMSNSSDRTVRLLSTSSDTLDVYTYSANNSAGFSDEKIELTKDNSPANWNNSLSENGTPGDENSVSPKQFDLAITNVRMVIPSAFEGIPLPIEAKLENFGTQDASNFAVSLFDDVNNDSLATANELIETRQVPSLIAGDTSVVSFIISNPVNRVYNFILNVDLNGDEIASNNTAFFEVSVAPKPNNLHDITITEIMYSPASGQPEWIEIYNTTIDDINLKSWAVSDNSSTASVSDDDLLIPALSYLVISDDDNIKDFFEFDAPLVVLNLPSLNNSGDDLVLLDSLNRAIDSVQYKPTWGGTGGKSLERVNPLLGSNDSTNWSSAITIANATPGGLNSVSSRAFDLKVDNVFVEPEIPIEGGNVSISAVIKNKGTFEVNSFDVSFYLDENTDSIAQTSELVSSQVFNNLQSGDSINTAYSLTNTDAGDYDFIIAIEGFVDQFDEDNIAFYQFTISEKPADYNDIVINEIMYTPSTDEPEWVELFNSSDNEWNLKDWRFSDRSSSVIISEDDFILQPNKFVVLSDDESLNNFYDIPSELFVVNLPSLNNSDDGLKIIDGLGNFIDSVNYKSTWGGSSEGRSLERKSAGGESSDSTNWGSADISVIATPGKINSIVLKEFDLRVNSISISPEIPISGDDVVISALIENAGSRAANQYTVTFFNDENSDFTGQPNELVSTENFGNLNSGEFQIATSLFGAPAVGEYQFIVEIAFAQDELTGNNIDFISFTVSDPPAEFNDIVINEIMHSPSSDEPEWIEIFNRSQKTIDLKNYRVADLSDTVTIFTESTFLAPEEFFVIADDSAFIEIYPNVREFIIKSIPSLNNSSDDVKLINNLDQVVDSVQYKSSWGGTNGRSLERIDFNGSSNDSTNWISSNIMTGGSPGTINTVAQKELDVAAVDLIFNPELPLIGDDISVSVKIKNLGKTGATFSLILFEDLDLDSLSNIIVERIDNISLLSGDSSIIAFDYQLENIQRETGYLVFVELNNDGDNSNDFVYGTIIPGYPAGSVVINEIHYTPSDGEPEWFELVNNSEESINIKNWLSKDVLTTPKEVTIVDSSVTLAPNKFIVVAKDSSVFDYHLSIPTKVITSNFATLNNSEDGLVIKDATGRTIDSVYFSTSFGGGNGISLERIDLNASSSDLLNWASSTDIEKSTPGRVNSVVLKESDLVVAELIYDPEFPVLNDDVVPSVKVKNSGLKAAENFSVTFNVLTDGSLQQLSRVNGLTLNASDSVIVSSTASFSLSGTITIIVEIEFALDEEPLNNIFEEELIPGFTPKSLIITEFMSQPVSGETEWIELLNISGESINIGGWSVSDVLSSPTKNFITEDDLNILPNEYFIVVSDATGFTFETDSKIFEVNFGTLGNTEDGIILYDFRDAIIDSLFYDRRWNISRGQSAERISLDNLSNNSMNWTSTLNSDGGTPGTVNSITGICEYSESSVVINEIMFEVSSTNSEFVELVNISDSLINMGGWKLVDEAGNETIVSPVNFLLEPNNLFVLAADTTILDNYSFEDISNLRIAGQSDLGLSNSGEILLLKDIHGNVIDSINYNAKWHNNFSDTKNLSLERINPSLNSNDPYNWSTSVDASGATPLCRNSIFTELGKLESKLEFSVNPFSPDNDGFEDFTIISYNLKNETSQIRIKIFDDKGRKIRTLVNNRASGSSGSVIFDGLDDEGKALRIGMYIVFLEAIGTNSSTVETLKKIIVIARPL